MEKVRRVLKFAGSEIFDDYFGAFCVAEVGEFDAEGLLRVLKRARRCRRGPVDVRVGPDYANLVFSKVSDDPNTWIKAVSSAYEDLNRRVVELSDHLESLCLSFDRALKIIERREKVI